ncbi:unnamed protein product [Porites lobata]|uniref:Uncharacterized protein n=1 Tax=Porites lobata TaxID=104759 RepID=A0ABN8NFZ1_9CNID|nr:unnamed protein product [Porites lobata]
MLVSNVKKFYPAQMPARLGFKGFLVQEGKNEPYLIIGPETKELQLQLLASMPLDLPGDSSLLEDNIKEVKEAVNSGVIIAEEVPQPSASTLRSKRAAPPYLPQQWFLNRKIRECNNCYNYANNVRTYTFAQPGEATGTPFQLNNPPSVQASAVSDNLAVLAPNPPQPLVLPNPGPNQHYVALVVDPGAPNRRGDFHWYRRDGEFNNRRWSHKPGETIPTNKDNNGHYITDPRLAAMGHYQFVAFMTTNPNAVNINNGVYPAGCDPNQG